MDADAGEARHGQSIACPPYMSLTVRGPSLAPLFSCRAIAALIHISTGLHSNGSSTNRELYRDRRLIVDQRRRFAGMMECLLLLSGGALLVVPKCDQLSLYLRRFICVHPNAWRRVVQVRVQRCASYRNGLRRTGACGKYMRN